MSTSEADSLFLLKSGFEAGEYYLHGNRTGGCGGNHVWPKVRSGLYGFRLLHCILFEFSQSALISEALLWNIWALKIASYSLCFKKPWLSCHLSLYLSRGFLKVMRWPYSSQLEGQNLLLWIHRFDATLLVGVITLMYVQLKAIHTSFQSYRVWW